MEDKKFAPLIQGLKQSLTVSEYEAEKERWKYVWAEIHRAKCGDSYMPNRRNLQALCSLGNIPPEWAVNDKHREGAT